MREFRRELPLGMRSSVVASSCGLQKVEDALSHLPFEGKHHAFPVQSLFLSSAPDMKRKGTEIQGNTKKKSEKDGDQEVDVKGSGVKRKERDSERLTIYLTVLSYLK